MRIVYILLAVVMCLIFTDIFAAKVTVTVGGSGNSFSPASFTINPGDTVEWVWAASSHNTSASTIPAGASTWYSNINSATTSFYYVPVVSGLYTYTCTFHSGMNGQFFVTGCTYPAKPVVTSSKGNSICAGDTAVLSITPQKGVSYQWINGVTTMAGATAASVKVTQAGNYKILVNRCGVDSVSTPFALTVNVLPKPSFTYSSVSLTYIFTNTTSPLAGNTYVWLFGDGTAPQTSTDASHTYTADGAYRVVLQAVNNATTCADTTSMFINATLGITKPSQSKYYIYPNPATSIINIEGPEAFNLALTDISGKVLPVAITRTSTMQTIDIIDISMLKAGIYFLVISSGDGIWRGKVVVE